MTQMLHTGLISLVFLSTCSCWCHICERESGKVQVDLMSSLAEAATVLLTVALDFTSLK